RRHLYPGDGHDDRGGGESSARYPPCEGRLGSAQRAGDGMTLRDTPPFACAQGVAPQDERTLHCYVCGSREIMPDCSPGAAACEACVPAREHVVSMQTGRDGASLAVCPCGWTSEVKGKGRHIIQDAKVR